MKKKIALICMASMLISSLAGCGSIQENTKESSAAAVSSEESEKTVSSESSATASEEASVEEPKQELPISDGAITLTVAIPVNAKVEDISTSTLALYIEEQTGINLEFVELSPSDAASQVNALMNGGDLPDVFLGYNFPYDALCSYADAGLLLPLDEYIDEWGYNLKNTIMEDPDLGGEMILAHASHDGHVWAMPSGGALVTNIYNGNLVSIQCYFLRELGLDMPATLDEFRDYLMAVKKAYPDVTPMTAYADKNLIFSNISQAYQYTDVLTYLKVAEDGTIDFIGNNELFKEALQYTKGMVDDGLIDPAAWTQDKNTLAVYTAQDGYNVAAYGCGNSVSSVTDTKSDEYLNAVKLGLLEGPYGYKAVQYDPTKASVKRSMVITSACEYPEEAFRMFDFFLSDEFAIQARVGTEGEQWKKAADGVLGRDEGQAWFELLTAQEWTQPSTNVVWITENFIHSNIMNHCSQNAPVLPVDDAKIAYEEDIYTPQELMTYNFNEGLPQLVMSAETAAEYNELRDLIVGSVNTNIALFVLGNRDLSEWDDYCKELEAMGVERYVELAQEAYTAMDQ